MSGIDGTGTDTVAPDAGYGDLASALTAGDRAGGTAEIGARALEVIPGLGDGAAGTDAPPLRHTLTRYGAGPLAVLFAINSIDELDRVAFVTLAPNIAKAFDMSTSTLLAINGVSAVLVIPLAIPFAILADRGRRTTLAGVAALVWSVFAFLTGLVTAVWQMVTVRILSGVGKAAVEPVHGSLLADYYPVEARGRVYAVHAAAYPFAGLAGPILAGSVAAIVGGPDSWRWAFVVMAPLGVAAGLRVLPMREPERGGHERVGLVDGTTPTDDAVDDTGAPRIPFSTGFRRLLTIQSLKYLYVGIGVLGFGIVSGGALLSLYFEDHWGVGEFGRGAIFSIAAVGSVLGLPIGGVAGDRLFRHNPAWPLFVIGAAIPLYTIVAAAALYFPQLWMVVAVYTLANAAVSIATAPLRLIVSATAPPALRSLSFALLGIFIFLMGGFMGGIVVGAISDATSPRFAFSLLAVPGLVSGVLIAYGSRFVAGDIAMVVADILEAERARERRRAGSKNLLEVRNLDFSYGPVQVLFGVDLDVEEGEVVALLGTNGAGKSTLLRAIVGLDHPMRGSIRFNGLDITYLETEQIVSLGISQMPGGKAVFPGLSVIENLRAGAYSFRHDTARIEREIRQVEDWFPLLAKRRNQPAGTLSGGEQQMLALGKAFLTRPKIMCIDELSLGLAPVIVESLFAILREMHEQGTTLIVVEQSVNVALALATTAIFMEKGQVRFRGPASDLLDRPDLVRSVFLEGAARGVV